MHTLVGFISYPDLVDNTLDTISPIGEISTDSLTFSKQTGFYKNPDILNTQLYTFEIEENEVDNSQKALEVEQALKIGRVIYDLATAGEFDEALVNFNQKFRANIDIEFALSDASRPITFNGNVWPTSLRYRIRGSEETHYLWFSDTEFQRGYNFYEIEVITPIENVDDFFLDTASLNYKLSQNDTVTILDRAASIRDAYPYSKLKALNFKFYVQPGNEESVIKTTWTLLIYGKQGTHTLAYLDKLQKYILSKSTQPVEVWEEHLPEIFKPIEFFFYPLWNLVAIPNKTTHSAYHKSFVNLSEMISTVSRFTSETQDLMERIDITSLPYRGLSLASVSSIKNPEELRTIQKFIPDYFSVPITSYEFGKMAPDTQKWVMEIYSLLGKAETYRQGDPLPQGYFLITRNASNYIAKTISGVHYTMITRESLYAAYGMSIDDLYTNVWECLADGNCNDI